MLRSSSDVRHRQAPRGSTEQLQPRSHSAGCRGRPRTDLGLPPEAVCLLSPSPPRLREVSRRVYPSPVRPNVLLIVLDTARADALEPYGAPAGSTPVIADLASRGVVLDRMFANACWTMPSHVAMFTGLLPRANGICEVPDGNPASSAPIVEGHADRFLPLVFKSAGYQTRAVSCNVWISEQSGFGTGFDEFVGVDTGRQAGLHSESLRDRAKWDLEAARAKADDGAGRAGQILRRWIQESDQEPSFWFVNLVECHSPYLPPRPYNDLGLIDRLRAGEEARNYLTLGAIWRACAGALTVPEPAIERMRHLYSRAVRSMDDWLGRILETLDSRGILDDTLVIVTSDHGENFGENGYMGHAFSLDDRLTRVPFVAAGPGAPLDEGVSSLAGVPRMLAEAVGLEGHPWGNSLPPGDVAVAQFDPPATIDHPRWQQRIEEWGVGQEIEWRVAKQLTSATDGRHKLVLRGEREELYDLSADPLEVSPVDPASSEGLPPLSLLRAALEHPATRAVTGAAPPRAGESPVDEEELQALEERMKLLGYM